MFETLTEKLQRTFKNLRGQGKLTEEHLDAALAEIREALLEGDVNLRRGGRIHRARAREGARVGGAAAAFARAAGGENRARRAGGTARPRGAAAVCVAAAFGVADLRAARIGQDDFDRKAREMAGGAWAPADRGFDGRLPSGGARATGASGEGDGHADLARAREPTSRLKSCAARCAKRSFRRAT